MAAGVAVAGVDAAGVLGVAAGLEDGDGDAAAGVEAGAAAVEAAGDAIEVAMSMERVTRSILKSRCAD